MSTQREAGTAVLLIAIESLPLPPSLNSSSSSLDPAVDPEDGLALSACEGILQEHRGQIARERREDGAILLRVELPITESAPARTKESTVPVLWQSRPYA
jgi:hypothetical protein